MTQYIRMESFVGTGPPNFFLFFHQSGIAWGPIPCAPGSFYPFPWQER